jgi:hypothetical protein
VVAGLACLALAGCGSTAATTTTKTPRAYRVGNSAPEVGPKPVPAGVSWISVRAADTKRHFSDLKTIDGPRAVAEAIAVVDGLTQVRRGEVFPCPFSEPLLTVELQFRKPLPAVAPAATVQASEPDCAGLVGVTIEGHQQPGRFGARSVSN